MTNRRDIAILIGALAVVIAAALARPQQSAKYSTYSSYDTGRNGYRAIYEVMRREDVDTRRLEQPLGMLRQASGTIVISGGLDGRVGVTVTDARRLVELARGGTWLVVLGVPDDALAAELAMPEVRAIPRTDAAIPVQISSLTRNVRRIAGNFGAAFLPHDGWRTVLRAHGNSVAVVRPFHAGGVVAMADPEVFSNAMLERDDNARFAYDALRRGPLEFDERVHGYVAGTSMWAVMPETVHDAVWISLGALVLAVVMGAFRSAPPVALEPPRPRDSVAYITAMATLLRRARAGKAALERFEQEARRLTRSQRARAARPAIAERVAELERLSYIARPPDAAVLAAARAYWLLRRELSESP